MGCDVAEPIVLHVLVYWWKGSGGNFLSDDYRRV